MDERSALARLVEISKEADSELGVLLGAPCCPSSLLCASGGAVVEHVPESSCAYGSLAAGETILAVCPNPNPNRSRRAFARTGGSQLARRYWR